MTQDKPENYAGEYIRLRNSLPNTKILIITKGVKQEKIIDFIRQTGHLFYGENYATELKKWEEIRLLFPEVELTFVGAFQSGNVRNIVKHCNAVYGISSFKDLEKLQKEALKKEKQMYYYAQINLDGEKNKNGFLLTEVTPDFSSFFEGLMCIPPFTSSPRKYFMQMRDIAKSINIKSISMGMSGDYIEAIKCGATEIRVGSLIFGKNPSIRRPRPSI